MEDIFADAFEIKFTSCLVFDDIHKTNAIEIKSKINEKNIIEYPNNFDSNKEKHSPEKLNFVKFIRQSKGSILI